MIVDYNPELHKEHLMRLERDFPMNRWTNPKSFETNKRKTFLSYDGSVPNGYIVARPEGGAIVVSKLFVHKDYRGKGLGDQLLNHVHLMYGGREFHLHVRTDNHHAINKYFKHGYAIRDVHSGYYQNGDDAFGMVRTPV